MIDLSTNIYHYITGAVNAEVPDTDSKETILAKSAFIAAIDNLASYHEFSVEYNTNYYWPD